MTFEEFFYIMLPAFAQGFAVTGFILAISSLVTHFFRKDKNVPSEMAQGMAIVASIFLVLGFLAAFFYLNSVPPESIFPSP